MRFFVCWLLVTVVLVAPAALAFAGDVSVNGYFRRDGTYVQPQMRSAPDSSDNNNWLTSLNVNPYTGKQGTNPPRLFDGPASSGSSQQPIGGFQQMPFGGFGSGPVTPAPRSRSGW